ncbi:MAG: chemotaxis response regulator protein-glutamate methylesterase [Actinomycetota bacterium]|nr:chemotaxis response regulator protein-glutamate methylesterase [Actinomycetota bacterium]
MPPIRVLVVDDSVVIRRLVTSILSGDPDIEVVGHAANGQIAMGKVESLSPDAITLDIEMPVMDGIATVRALRRAGHRMPVIMFSTLTERGATATLDALEAGASDYVAKPANVGSVTQSLEQVRASLIPKIKALCGTRRRVSAPRPGAQVNGRMTPTTTSGPPVRPPAGRPPVLAARRGADTAYRVLAVGCSTGGPEALGTLLGALPASLGVPVVVVQHMPPVFTTQFAARLDRLLPLTVVEATAGQVLRPGHVYIAPGDIHLKVVRTAAGDRVELDRGAPENFCRPAVDVLFRSVVATYGRDVLAAVLTGMGQDGRRGALDIVAAGGSVLAQDEATSVVWGMPGAVVNDGAAEEVLPIGLLGPALAQRLFRSGPSGPKVATGTRDHVRSGLSSAATPTSR